MNPPKAMRRRAARESGADTRRRESILAAALASFDERGYAGTTIADIQKRSGASTGSLYHHFTNKERLFAELYAETVRLTQDYALRSLERHGDVESGLRALVSSYLSWVRRNPQAARFLLTMRDAEFQSEERIEELNRHFAERLAAWYASADRRGWSLDLEPDLVHAILLGPSEVFARRWLQGKTATSLRQAAAELADASIRALRKP